MEYAIFKTGGKQYKTSVGETIVVDKLNAEKDSSIFLNEVLLSVSGESILIGKPFIEGAKIKATIVDQKKGEKLRVSKFKAKARYRRTMGFRPL